jgi:hypothetical protein
MMAAPMKRLLVLHHSHTDIGYTEPQARIGRWHADFLRQAMTLAAADPTFRWVAETFWSVERFLEAASPAEQEQLAALVREGRIGLSASWANLDELPDEDLLRAITRRAVAYGESIGSPVRSAMTADVNGHAWGLAQVLVDLGVENLFSCVHTHHGRYPLERTQTPFRWETPRGDRLLVWSGEHYHFGNELGLVPDAVSSYLTKDECDADMVFHDARGVATIRIPRYLAGLEERGFPFDFVPVMASGLRTDNGPPSPALPEQIRWWNEEHGDVCRIEMATIDDVFRLVRESGVELPTYRGAWPDWWSDGPAASPVATRLFREAQRNLAFWRRLRAACPEIGDADVEGIETELAHYAEHTFGHSDAMGSPWHLLVHAIAGRKHANAARALDSTTALLDRAAEDLGGKPLRVGQPLRYRVLHPGPGRFRGLARLGVGHHEWHERGLDAGVVVHEEETLRHELFEGARVLSATIAHPLGAQADAVPRGAEIAVPVDLEAGEALELVVDSTTDEPPALERLDEPADGLETPFVRLAWREDGIVSLEDRQTGRSLLRADRLHAPLTPVHEITPCALPDEVGAVRARLRLNRKGEDAVRSAGTITQGRIVSRGEAFVRAELRLDLPGTTFCSLELTAHRTAPRLDVALRMAKESRWEPENVYLSMPFAPSDEAELRIYPAGAIVRPRIDQIPGTLTDFHTVQEGWHVTDGSLGIVVASLDAPLLWLGPLEAGERLLAGDPRLADDPARPYAWLMTNYWETNFDASLGGFHEFRLALAWGEDLVDPERAREAAVNLGRDPLVVRRGGGA